MTHNERHILNFHASNGAEWQDEHATFVPRPGDMFYPYEQAKGVYRVEEVWVVGESNGAVTQGTHVFLTEVPMEGTRLHSLDPKYYS